MPELRLAHAVRDRVLRRALRALPALAVVLLALAAPGAALGRGASDLGVPEIHLAAVPGDEPCANESPDPRTGQKLCDKPLLGVGTIVPIIGVVVGGGALALVVAYLVLRRRASVPLAPTDAGAWWLCPKCGSTNVVGTARCYACGTWQR